jgi:hypothetical protein
LCVTLFDKIKTNNWGVFLLEGVNPLIVFKIKINWKTDWEGSVCVFKAFKLFSDRPIQNIFDLSTTKKKTTNISADFTIYKFSLMLMVVLAPHLPPPLWLVKN